MESIISRPKRIIAWCLSGLLAVVVAMVVAGDVLVKVYVDGKLMDFEPAARVRNGTTYAPLRAAAEAVGAHVTWNAKSQMAVVCRGQQCVPIKKSQGIIILGRLLIPLRLMATALNCQVRWDEQARAVRIETKSSALPH